MIQNTQFSVLVIHLRRQQVRATEQSIFKQGLRKHALHSAALGAAIYSPRVVWNSLKALAQRQGTSLQLGQKQCVPLPHNSPKTRTLDSGKGQPFLGQTLSQGLQTSTAQHRQTELCKTRAPRSLFGILHLPGAARTSSTFFTFSVQHDSVLLFQKAFRETMYFSL